MIRFNKFHFVFVSILIFTIIKNLSANDVFVTNQSNQGLTIVFTPQDWRISSEIFENKSYIKINFKNGSSIPVPGNPEIPVRTVMIGIPFESKVSLEINNTIIKKTLIGKILPAPQIGGEELSDFQFVENGSIYQSNLSYPSQAAEISSPKIMRDVQVVALNLYPVQFEPSNEKIYLYRQLVVRVNFLNGKQETNNIGKSKGRLFYENILDLLVWVEFVPSKSEARRKINEGAVKLNDEKITDYSYEISFEEGEEKILKLGRKIIKIKKK